MNAHDPGLPPDDPDLLAAEYVIGLLTPDEMRDVETKAIGDPTLAASILAWQARLHPLTEVIPPVAPPVELLRRLETTLGFVRPHKPNSPHLWWRWVSAPAMRGALVGAVCTAIVGGAVFGPKLMKQRPEIAALISIDGEKTDYHVEMTSEGIATVVAINPNATTDRSLQLWTLDGATPVSLGLLPPRGHQYTIERRLVPGAKLLVSEEPKGGSKDAGPTGPIKYQGKLIRG